MKQLILIFIIALSSQACEKCKFCKEETKIYNAKTFQTYSTITKNSKEFCGADATSHSYTENTFWDSKPSIRVITITCK